jgi:hypothetical protein
MMCRLNDEVYCIPGGELLVKALVNRLSCPDSCGCCCKQQDGGQEGGIGGVKANLAEDATSGNALLNHASQESHHSQATNPHLCEGLESEDALRSGEANVFSHL